MFYDSTYGYWAISGDVGDPPLQWVSSKDTGGGTPAGTYVNDDGSYAHTIGLIGELAIAKHLGMKVDDRIFQNKGDGGLDFDIPGLGKTQVKTTTYGEKPLLRAEVKKDKSSIDAYLLVYVNKKDYKEVYLIGWAKREDVIKAPKRKFSRYGPLNYVMSEEELNRL